MAESDKPVARLLDFAPGYNASKPRGFIEKPKPRTQRLSMGKTILPPSIVQSSSCASSWATGDFAIPKTSSSANNKKNERKSYSSAQLNSKAKAMMAEDDQRDAYEAYLIKEKKKIADREGFEAYMQQEAWRHAKELWAKKVKAYEAKVQEAKARAIKAAKEYRDIESGGYDDEVAIGW